MAESEYLQGRGHSTEWMCSHVPFPGSGLTVCLFWLKPPDHPPSSGDAARLTEGTGAEESGQARDSNYLSVITQVYTIWSVLLSTTSASFPGFTSVMVSIIMFAVQFGN